MSADRDRDPTQRTTAPAGVLGAPVKPEAAPKPESGEKRVPKSAFAQTILQVPGAGAQSDHAASEAEPLREPSDRPAPTPYNRPHGAWGGTLPMPDAVPPGNRSEERMIAAKPPQQQPAAPAPARSPAAQYIKPGATMAMPTLADDVVQKAQAARAPQPAQPKGMPTQVMGTPPTGHVISPAPPPPSRSDRAPAPKLTPGAGPRIEATGPVPAVDASPHSQPLSLSLHARDHLESAGPAAQPPGSKTPLWILASVGVVVVVGVLIWLFRPSPAHEPPPVVPPTAVAPAVTPEPLPSTTPEATPPVQAATPTPTPTPAPAAPVVKPEPEPEKPAVEKTASAPRPKATAKKKKKVAAVKEGPVLQVKPSRSGSTEDDLEKAARAAERLAEENDAPPSPDEPPSPDGE